MELFDYIIMGTGALLLVIGVLIFIAGKRESANPNQMEGFGIKLNVSNPSIILIVLGIGLLLVPRLLPHNEKSGLLGEPNNTAQKPAASPSQIVQQPEQQPINNNQSPASVQPQRQPVQANPQTQQMSVFLPNGSWELDGYELNGADISLTTDAEIYFTGIQGNQVNWNSQFWVSDIFGNQAQYQYQGDIVATNAGYSIRILSSNDPTFFGAVQSPLTMMMEGDRLHMEYNLNGSSILLHWIQ